jgi:fibronectin type 3 domain-containing protein
LALVGLCLLAGLLPDTAQAQMANEPGSANEANAILYGVLAVRATVQESPAQITLTWPSVTGSGGFNIYRKAREAGSFGSVYATVAQGVTSYSDTNVVVGTGYEYEVKSVNEVGNPALYVDGFVYSGIALPTMDSRGKVILLVDNTMTNALAGELARFEQDLVGDGWTVLRHDVTRQTTVTHNATTTEVATIKAIIKDDYTNDTANVKTVLLFGRVPIPYSGQLGQ